MTAGLRQALVTVFGLGLLRPAPGTWGSLPPPVLVLVMLGAGAATWMINTTLAAVAVIFSAACVLLGPWAERHFDTKDPRQVVADETVGASLALLALPWREGAWSWNIALALTAFGAFRVLDILKPPPIRSIQRAPGGWGILLDDVGAGLLALATGHLCAWLIWPKVL